MSETVLHLRRHYYNGGTITVYLREDGTDHDAVLMSRAAIKQWGLERTVAECCCEWRTEVPASGDYCVRMAERSPREGLLARVGREVWDEAVELAEALVLVVGGSGAWCGGMLGC